jgi:hypothetical protein
MELEMEARRQVEMDPVVQIPGLRIPVPLPPGVSSERFWIPGIRLLDLTPEQAALPVKRMCPQSLLAFPRGWIRDRAIQNGIPGFHITCQECGAVVRVWWLTKDVNSPAQVFWHVYGQPTGTEDASGRG